ncbi:sensor histidine kinase [Lacrimispora sp.]|uniref:sensor histidine kinase n=1 Tax=Lacrimispora sp. TaxID=2719234 RepID=UPI00346076DA
MKILIAILLFTAATSITISFIHYQTYSRYMEQELLLSSGNDVQYSKNFITFHMGNIDNLMKWCQNNTEVINYVLNPTSKNKVAAHNSLSENYNACNSNVYISRMMVASDYEEYIQLISSAYSTVIDVKKAIGKIDNFEQLLQNPGSDFKKGIISDPFHRTNPKDVLLLVRPVYNAFNSKIIGWILVEIDSSLFSDALTTYSTSQEDLYYLSIDDNSYLLKDKKFISVPSPIQDNQIRNRESYLKNNDNDIYFKKDRNYFIGDTFNNYPLVIIKETKLSVDFQKEHYFVLTLSVILLLMILFSCIIMLYLYYLVNRPIQRLQKQLYTVSQGDFSPSPSIEWNNEFGVIGRGINQLSVEIKHLIQEKLDNEKTRQKIEYELLQNQISPHFLYNTLSSVKWLSTLQGATGIADIISALASLLKRVSKKNNENTSLSDELDLLKDYFTIQKFRYGGTISLEYNIEQKELLDCHILSFTLQPIVENAIFHGIEPKKSPGSIMVRVFSPDENVLQIDVTDDGIGMSAEKIDSILPNPHSSKSGFFAGIGIGNVHKRLQLEYGSDYGLNIRSEPGIFTTVSIRIPLIL